MGNVSYFEWEDIEVINEEGLKIFLERWNKAFPNEKCYTDGMLDQLRIDQSISFANWDGWKIISYWYKNTCLFLKCIAKYIYGHVHWNFENDDEAGWVEFRKKKCTIHAGVTDWSHLSPEEMKQNEFETNEVMKEFLLIEDI